MKKLFYVVALVAAVTLSACGNKNQQDQKSGYDEAPEALQEVVDNMRLEMEGKSANGITYDRLDIEGTNIEIVYTFACNDNVDEAIEGVEAYSRANGEECDAKERLFNMHVVNEEGVKRFSTMREYESDLIFRFSGSNSGEEVEVVLSHEDLPEVNMDDVDAMRAQYADLPKEIVDVISEFETMFSVVSQRGMTYNGTTVEGNDLVFTLGIDEETFGIDNFREQFIKNGFTEKRLHDQLLEAVSGISGAQAEKDIIALKEYKYNIVVRYEGSKSKAILQARLRYDELP